VDTAKEPGIIFLGVVVERIRFDDIPSGVSAPQDLQYQVGIQRRELQDPKAAEIILNMRVFGGADVAKFNLEVSVSARFQPDESSANMPLSEFLKSQAPALVMPFVRELVANITFRSRRGLVLLPPINVLALVQREEVERATV